ncbi:MAG: hypothetical protein ACRD2T_05215, partial [Thermoanaerobaculia bacterium]
MIHVKGDRNTTLAQVLDLAKLVVSLVQDHPARVLPDGTEGEVQESIAIEIAGDREPEILRGKDLGRGGEGPLAVVPEDGKHGTILALALIHNLAFGAWAALWPLSLALCEEREPRTAAVAAPAALPG